MEWLQQYTPNELHREFLGVNGLNPWDGWDSSSRKQMFSSHIGQTLVVRGATERYCQTGMEREFGKYTFNVKMPCNGQVLQMIDRYPRRMDKDDIKFNPQSILVYENHETKEIGMVNLPAYCSQHQYFGFPYKERPIRRQATKNQWISAGEIFLDSPSITEDGGYKYGVQANIAFMSHPAVSEDGILISRSALRRFGFVTYERREVEYGSKRMPLNLYGDDETFRPFPDIGEPIRPDGVLMGTRSYDRDLAPVEQSVRDLQEIDHNFDRLVYAAGAGGRVVDIRVYHDKPNQALADGMDSQPLKYDRARRSFYTEIVDLWKRKRRERMRPDGKEGLQITPEFHRMVVEALSVVGSNSQHPTEQIKMLYRQTPLDDWRIEFVIEYEITPTIGFKLTDCHGGKGVVCKVVDDEDMPVDAAGNRAEIVMDPAGIISRMNIGRCMELFTNGVSRDVAKRVQAAVFGLDHAPTFPDAVEYTGGATTFYPEYKQKSQRDLVKLLTQLQQANDPRIEAAMQKVIRFYEIVSPQQASWFKNGEYTKTKAEHLANIINDGICYLFLPPDNQPEGEQVVLQLEREFPSTYGPVTYRGNSGRMVTTKDAVRIASLYIILLEKIADDWTAVSSGKTQHFGVLAQVTNADKYSQPFRAQAIRAWGEAEVRIGVAYCGSWIMAEILDRNNNPRTHQAVVRSILHAEKPTDIANAVDRKQNPYGGSKPLQLVNHLVECGGFEFQYKEFNPGWQVAQTYRGIQRPVVQPRREAAYA